MTTRITGLGSSGLDIDTLVSQMMQAKRVPIDQMKQKMTYLSWQRDAYRDMNTDMSGFMNEAQKLTLQSTFMTKKATMSDTDSGKVQVTPTANSLVGNFTLEVDQIAKSASTSSSASIGAFSGQAGSLQVTGQLGTKQVDITAGDSVAAVASKINQQTSLTGVKAVYDQLSDKMTLVSSQTGSAAKIQVVETTSSTNLENLKLVGAGVKDTGLIPGQDAKVKFNSTNPLDPAVSVGSNSFTLNGFNFTLLADPAGTPYTINASNNLDVDSVVNTIKGVFDKYNTLIDKANAKISEEKYRDYQPLTDDQKKDMKDSDITIWNQKAMSGLLKSDDIISAGLDTMRSNLSAAVSGLPAPYNSLASIGITTAPTTGSSSTQAYLENGKIYIDEDKLRTALTNAPDQVVALFTATGTQSANGRPGPDAGIGTQLYSTLKSQIVSQLTEKTQIVPQKSYLNIQIDDYATRISEQEATLNDYEQQLYSNFTNMETALDNLNKQGSYLSSLLK